MSAPIRSMAELVGALRDRAIALNLSHETIDAIAGVPSGYTSKLFADKPMKRLGYTSVGLLLGALGMQLIPAEDQEQVDRVKSRWKQRMIVGGSARQLRQIATLSIPLSMPEEITKTPDLERKQRMQELGRKGGKRRLVTMSKRARQRVATHAARKRWGKRADAK